MEFRMEFHLELVGWKDYQMKKMGLLMELEMELEMGILKGNR
jgi:hypothetical protein